jgi:hypothetical protein
MGTSAVLSFAHKKYPKRLVKTLTLLTLLYAPPVMLGMASFERYRWMQLRTG